LQQVHINRLGVNSIEFETDPVEVPLSPGGERSFEMVIINYGSPTHVHLSTSESLKDNVTFLENNPYVRHEEYIPVIVRIPAGGRLFTKGEVFITVGYGSKKEGFTIKIGIPDPEEVPVEVDVDEELSTPSVNSGSRVTRDWDAQFHEVSAHLFKGFYDAMSLKVVFFIVGVSILTIVFYLFAKVVISVSFETLPFYPAIALSILFTAFIAYLLVKLPIIK
jgi:hypothetical protein